MALEFYRRRSPDPAHHERIQLALAYLDGARDSEPLTGVMVRLLLRSVVSEYEEQLQREKGSDGTVRSGTVVLA